MKIHFGPCDVGKITGKQQQLSYNDIGTGALGFISTNVHSRQQK